MKKAFASCFIVVVILLALSGCQLIDSLFGGNSALFELTENTAPCVATGARTLASEGNPRAFIPGGPTYRLFSMFEEYSYPEDEGLIDTGNIYKLVFEASMLMEGNKYSAVSIPLTAIPSPFDFGIATESYDHGYNEEGTEERGNIYDKTLAYREDGTTTHALLGYTVHEPVEGGTKVQRQIFQTTFDTATEDIALEFATFDDKPNSDIEDFGRRFYVQGNAGTHEFFCHLASGQGASVSSIVGKGFSGGTGYYILCIAATDRSGDRYYRLPAGAVKSDFEDLDESGTALGDLDDPEGYAAFIDDYLRTDAYATRSVLPTKLEDFTNNGFVELPE